MTVEQFIKKNNISDYLGFGFVSHMQRFGQSDYSEAKLLREYMAFAGCDLDSSKSQEETQSKEDTQEQPQVPEQPKAEDKPQTQDQPKAEKNRRNKR